MKSILTIFSFVHVGIISIFFTVFRIMSPISPCRMIRQVSFECFPCVIIIENPVQSSLLHSFSTQSLSNQRLRWFHAWSGLKDIIIVLPWIGLFLLFIFLFFWMIEHVQYIGISICVVNCSFWPDFSPVRWVILH